MPGANTLYGAYLSTIGAEFEGLGITQGNLANELMKVIGKSNHRLYSITRDASVESMSENIGVQIGTMIQLYMHSGLARKVVGTGRGNECPLGYELIIDPIEDIEKFEEIVFKCLVSIENLGDFLTPRAATHFHVGFANNLRFLKNLLKICLWLDPLFFRLGGMGRTYRGNSNNSAYARPLLHSSAVPVVTSGGSDSRQNRPTYSTSFSTISTAIPQINPRIEGENRPYVKIINPMAALEATTLDEFWSSFGVFPTEIGLPKYHPARYTSFNFYSLSQHGTIEARHCNQSFNPGLVVAIAKLFRGSVELSTLIGKHEAFEFPPGDSSVQISNRDAEEILQTLQRYFYEKEVENPPDDFEFNLIMETISKSTFKPLPEFPVRTHLKDYHIRSDFAKRGKLEYVENVLNPSQVDIHTIEEQPFILDEE